jgi:hypothetical protein
MLPWTIAVAAVSLCVTGLSRLRGGEQFLLPCETVRSF